MDPLLLNEALTSSKGSSAPLSAHRHTAILESQDHRILDVGKALETANPTVPALTPVPKGHSTGSATFSSCEKLPGGSLLTHL